MEKKKLFKTKSIIFSAMHGILSKTMFLNSEITNTFFLAADPGEDGGEKNIIRYHQNCRRGFHGSSLSC